MTDGGGDSTWSDAKDVAGDVVLTQAERQYDRASHTRSHQSSDTHGGSETEGLSASDTEGTNGSTSLTSGWSTTWSPMLMPILGKEPLPPQFRSVQEQLFRFTQFLAFQPKRHCWAKLVGVPHPVALTIPLLKPPRTTRSWTERWTELACARTPFILPAAEATKNLELRQRDIGRLLDAPLADEPLTTRRPIRKKEEG